MGKQRHHVLRGDRDHKQLGFLMIQKMESREAKESRSVLSSSMIVWWRLRPVISFFLQFYAIIQRWSSGPIVPPPIRGQAPPGVPCRGGPASPPTLVSTISFLPTTFPVTATPARATGAFAFATSTATRRRRTAFATFTPAFTTFTPALTTFVAPDRRWRIYGPLQIQCFNEISCQTLSDILPGY
jgi:hypothetical protein